MNRLFFFFILGLLAPLWLRDFNDICCKEPMVEGPQSFCIEGKTWNYKLRYLDTDGTHEEPYSYIVHGDTIIGDYSYKKVYVQKDGTEKLAFMMREQECKLFKLKPNDFEQLFFDFGREDVSVVYEVPVEADGNEMVFWMISSIDSIQVDHRLFRRYCCYQTEELESGQTTIMGGDYVQTDYWVEGIGSASSGIEPYGTVAIPEILPGAAAYFISCYENGECIFSSNDFKKPAYTVGNYRHFLEDGKTWVYSCYNNFTGKSYNESRTVMGDTIIGNRTYKKIVDVTDPGRVFCVMREEGKKVYAAYPNNNTETLLFDFGLNVGDLFRMYSYGNDSDPDVWAKVVAVDTIVVGNRSFRVMDVRGNSGDAAANWWVEGIGSFNDTNFPLPGNDCNFSSCEVNGEVLFTNKDFAKLMGMEGLSQTICRESPSAIFDLQGRRLSGKPAKGVYIENGRKRVK